MVRPPIDDANAFSASTAPPFANVIVALDGSELAETILPHALSVAAASGARVLLLRVVEPVRAPLPALVGRDDPVTDRAQDTRDTAWRTASTYLNDVAAVVRDRHPSLDIDRELRFANSPGAAILKCAEAHERPLIALASHGRGLSRIFLGSVASAVVRGASAVLMCRARAV
jgi:nucleotide-binding universal stress UspA family protein